MATEILELRIVTVGASAATSEVDRMTKSADALTGALRFMRNALVALSFARILEGAVTAISSYQQIVNLMRTITSSQQEANDATQVAAQISIATRSNFEGTAKLMYNIAASTKAMNLDWAQVGQLTTTFNQSTTLAGLDQAAARNSMKDFIELLNVGVVQGRQFRALLMQDRPLIDAIATVIVATGAHAADVNKLLDKVREGGKNVSGGFLYELTQRFKGAFTSEDFVRAMQKQTEVGDKFNLTQKTISQAFEILKTQALVFFNNLWIGVEATGALTNVIMYVSENLKGLAEILATIGTLLAVRYIGVPIAAWFLGMAQGIYAAAAAAAVFAYEILAAGVTAVATFALAIPGAVATAAAAILDAFAAMGVALALFGTNITVTSGRLIIMFALIAAQIQANVVEAIVGLATSIAAAIPAALALSAVFIPLGVVIAGIGVSLYGLLAPLAQLGSFGALLGENLGGPFKDISITMKDIPTLFSAIVDTIAGQWPLITELLSALWSDMLNGMKNAWNNYWIDVINTAKGAISTVGNVTSNTLDRIISAIPVVGNVLKTALHSLDFESSVGTPTPHGAQLPTNSAAPYAKALSDITAANFVAEKNAKNAQITLPGKPAGAGSIVTPEIDKDLSAKIAAAEKSLADFLGRFGGPQAKFNKDMQDFNTVLFRASQVLPQVKIAAILAADGFDDYNTKTGQSKKLTDAFYLSVLGMTDEVRDAAQWQDLLNQAQARGIPVLEQYSNQMRILDREIQNIRRTDPSVAGGIKLAELEFQKKLATPGETAAQVHTKYALRDAEATNTLAVSVQTLNKDFASGAIDAEKYAEGIRDVQITALATQTDALSGYQKGLLEVQKSMADIASQTSQLVTGAFNNMTDALVNFAQTGKLNLKSLFDSIVSGLLRIAIQQQIMAPLAQSLGLSAGVGTAAAGAGGASSWGGGAGGIGSLLGNFATNANGNVGSGLFGAISDFGSFLGFANEGQFQVGGQGGTDSQMVAFRASPDETVSVTKPGRAAADHTQVVHVHVYGATNPNDFKASEGQVAAAAGGAMRRAQSRNGRN